jgi:glycosyltransferase involved in cell wall biosynthesis
MKLPKVSIVIGAYNCASFIEDTIESVRNQTFKDWELIVVDDCSRDNTYEKVKKINDERIRIIRLAKNSTRPAITRNIGINNSRGKFIAFLDHDDIWLPDKLNAQLWYFNQDTAVGLVSCYFKVVSSDKVSNNKIIAPKKDCLPGYLYYKLINFNFIAASSPVIRASVLNKVGHFNESANMTCVEDFDLWLRIAKFYKIAVIPKIMGMYKKHGFNSSQNSKQLKKSLFVVKQHLKQGWISEHIANKARSNFYLREGWELIDKDAKSARYLFYNALETGKGRLKIACLSIIGICLSGIPFLPSFIKNNSLDKKIGKPLINHQNI